VAVWVGASAQPTGLNRANAQSDASSRFIGRQHTGRPLLANGFRPAPRNCPIWPPNCHAAALLAPDFPVGLFSCNQA